MKLKTKLGKSYLSEYKDRILSSLDRKKCTTQGEVIRETMAETVLSILAFIKVNTTDEEYYNPLVWKIRMWINFFGKWNPIVELCFRLNMLREKSEENISEIIQLIKDNIEDYPDRKLYWDNDIVTGDRNLPTFIKNNDFLFVPMDNQKDNPGIIIRRNVKQRGMKMINLGLPSGTLWADRNLGADTPEAYGDYFRFGEKTPFTEDSPEYLFDEISDNIAKTLKDAVTLTLGMDCHTPTLDQIEELMLNCVWEWTTVKGVKGYRVTGPNGNNIFIPAAGYRYNSSGELFLVGVFGRYWSATPNNTKYGHNLNFYSSYRGWSDSFRDEGLSVRPVMNKKK